MTRVAVDVLGDDPAPGPGPDASSPGRAGSVDNAVFAGTTVAGDVVDGLLEVLDADPDLTVVLVGPEASIVACLARRGVQPGDRLSVVDGPEYIGVAGDPARAVRARRNASVRVAARLVREGRADALVSRGPVGAVVTAAGFVLGRIPGVTRAAVARVVNAPGGPVVLLDATGGELATPDATPDLVTQLALAGRVYASARFDLPDPRVALLSTVTDATGAGDLARHAQAQALAEIGGYFVGTLSADGVALGGAADVVVTDGFTGSVLASALAAAAGAGGRPEVAADWCVLGVDGVTLRAGGGPAATGEAVALAAWLVREELVARTRAVMGDLIAHRRSKAGLPV